MSSLEKSIMRRFPLPLTPRTGTSSGSNVLMARDFSPVPWSKYFQTKQVVNARKGAKFCVYRSSNTADPFRPVIYFLHGGGFSALTWSLMAKSILDLVECEVVAVDLRGHGETTTASDYDLNKDQLVRDLLDVMREVSGENDHPIILVGHSLGGALAVHFASTMEPPGEFKVIGVVVIDVVEGSALESLTTMNLVLRGRPLAFPSINKAIEWCVKSGQIRNIESARVSMPGQLKNARTNEPATIKLQPLPSNTTVVESSTNSHVSHQPVEGQPSSTSPEPEVPSALPLRGDVIVEEGESEESVPSPEIAFPKPKPVPHPNLESFTWRIDLNLTQPYWTEWFEGLSKKFLQLPCPKLLLLAGVDRLDRDLTVGQMQGKFQMQVFPNVGHAIQEDSPSEVAHSIASFLIRHKLVTGKVEIVPVLPGC